MKTVSAALAAHMAQDSTNLAMLWKVIRTDGTVLGFTNHDTEIVFTDSDDTASIPKTVTYLPLQGMTPSATETTSDMSVSNQESLGFLDSESITEVDLFAGKYDYATIEIRIVNYADLTMGALLWKNATMGEIKTQNGKFTAELRGLEFYMNTNIGETYGPTCRADLGDSRCTIDLSLWIQGGSVDTVTDLRTFVPNNGLLMVGSATPTDPAPADWFVNGVITWLTGANAGYTMECTSWDGTTIGMFENLPYIITPVDTFTIEPGCDFSTGPNGCGKFSNIDNFRGEPQIPGMDQILIYPNADGSVPGT
jgi:uncharacterized phage protein (TIGR02218 family)